MREEYDLGGAVRGRHAARYAEGVEVTTLEGRREADPDTVRLDPDVRTIFPDSQSVNEALRLVMKTAEKMQELRKAS